jgi:putative MATE family efflux protein
MRHSRFDQFLARPHRAVWAVSAPMMGGMALMMLGSVVEMAFVGRLGSVALAGLTLMLPLFFTMVSLINGVGTAITALVAQAIGRRDLAEAERIGGTAIALGVLLGAAVALLGVAFGHPLIRHLGATAEVFEPAWEYFFVLALTAPVMFVSAFLRFVLQGEGDSKTPMFVMAAVMVANMGLDWLFIFPLGQGLRGAALAGAISQTLAMVAMLGLLLWRPTNLVRLHWRSLWPTWRAVKAVLTLGVPNSLTQLSMAVGSMFLNRAVASFGDAALAAAGVGQRVDQLAVMPVMGLAAGSVAVIGMFAGASRADLVRDVALYAGRWAVAIASTLGVVAFATSGYLMRAFTSDPGTIAFGQHYLLYMVFAYPMMAVVMMSARILLGLSYPNLSLLIVLVRLFLLAVPIAYLSVFVFRTSIDGVWAGIVAGSAGAAGLAAWLVRKMVWLGDPTTRAAGGGVTTPAKTEVA